MKAILALPHWLRYLLACASGLVAGGLLLFISVAMLTDLPEEDDLKWIHSEDIARAKRTQAKPNDQFLRLTGKTGECFTISDGQDGFSELDAAILSDTPYSIGYHPERALFSDSDKRYNMIYVVQINGRTVLALSNRIRNTYRLFGGMLAAGLGIVGLTIYAFSFRGTAETRQQDTVMWAYFTLYLAAATPVGMVSGAIWQRWIDPIIKDWPAFIVSGLFALVVFAPMIAIMSRPLDELKRHHAKRAAVNPPGGPPHHD